MMWNEAIAGSPLPESNQAAYSFESGTQRRCWHHQPQVALVACATAAGRIAEIDGLVSTIEARLDDAGKPRQSARCRES